MATEHDEQTSPAASNEKKPADFEIEDIGLEEVAGGADLANCGNPCSSCKGVEPVNPA